MSLSKRFQSLLPGKDALRPQNDRSCAEDLKFLIRAKVNRPEAGSLEQIRRDTNGRGLMKIRIFL
jgi:hypothetical protein